MPIPKITENQKWLDVDKHGAGSLNPDVQVEAERYADRLLLDDIRTKVAVRREVADRFQLPLKIADAIVDRVIAREAEPVTIFNPQIKRKSSRAIITADVVHAGMVDETTCEIEDGRTIIAGRAMNGDTFAILSSYETDDAISILVDDVHRVLGRDCSVSVFSVDDNYDGLTDWLNGLGEFYSGMDFSPHLRRHIAVDNAPDIDFFDEDKYRPFSR